LKISVSVLYGQDLVIKVKALGGKNWD